MQVKSFGCSFIFGSDLADNVAARNQPRADYSRFTWPALLAKHLNTGYECYARPGSGNFQIMERILSQSVMDSDTNLFVIGWTWIDRFDYIDSQATRYNRHGFWKTLMPVDQGPVAETYYRDLHSECRDKLSTLVHMKIAIDMLKTKKIPFVMTYMDELTFDQTWHTTPAIIELQNYIKPYMTKFDGLTFLDWSRKNNFPESDMWHPLEQAHKTASDYVIESGVLSTLLS